MLDSDNSLTAYHPVGTCRMGPKDDPTSVLDWELRVRGIENLRVVDGSAFPSMTSGNPHAVTLMLAERAADFILRDIKKKGCQPRASFNANDPSMTLIMSRFTRHRSKRF
ncbi:alcohol dehydrogenase [Caerostris extrusa]|uniref:Alcohol dehydrogenase n=1 Tax=Caerostris extrusa TaxID=172846 RepID=A0AAV4VR92_CAEEX|nr:alcohol dehydrogenase [Caerostris extrusa]